MYDYKNKQGNVNLLNKYMLLKSLSMFKYEGLPDTISVVAFEKNLQQYGYVYVTEVNGELYAFNGNLGGELDVYGEPTEITINNVALKFNKTLNIKNDGVLIKNDDLMLGLIPLYNKYNSLLIENEVTMFISSFNARINALISAGDDKTKESAEIYLQKVIAGELGIIGENQLFDGIRAQNTSTTTSINFTQLIEFNQYLKATLYNEIGLDANFNMKRERLNSSEVAMNADGLFPLVDNMYDNRVYGIECLNEKYGLTASIDFDSSWKKADDEVSENNVPEVTSIEENEEVDEIEIVDEEIEETEIVDEIEIEENEEDEEVLPEHEIDGDEEKGA